MSGTRRKKRPAADGRAHGERLQKILSAAGIASRRASEDLLREGRVRVNGRVVQELGTRADPRRDRITVDGRRVGRARPHRYYVLYKPRGFVSTTHDPHAQRTVLELVPTRERVFPVGRLDVASEGLLLLTNDGAVAQALLHPSRGAPRTYRVSVHGRVDADVLRRLTRGISVAGQQLAVSSARLLEQTEDRSVLELILAEGRKHQIRTLLAATEHPVRRLVRTRFGPLQLRGLGSGEWRPPTEEERSALERMAAERPEPPPRRSRR